MATHGKDLDKSRIRVSPCVDLTSRKRGEPKKSRIESSKDIYKEVQFILGCIAHDALEWQNK